MLGEINTAVGSLQPHAVTGRSAMAKAFLRILPLILAAYVFAYMDRVNVSFAAEQMNSDLKFSATIYGLGGGLFFLAYSLFEIPSNLMLVRFGARPWIARIMITWGLLSAAMMFVQTPLQFYVLRFLLGVAEAGFFPGLITFFSGWFPPCHRGRAVSRIYIAGPVASVLMGAVSGWLLGLEGRAGLHGWQWLFLVQGLPTVFMGLIVLRHLPDTPATVSWLTTAEKDWIHTELAREQARMGKPVGHNVIAAFRNPRVLLVGMISLLLNAVTVAVVLNAPKLLEDATGLGATRVGYVVSLGGILGTAAILFGGNHVDRHRDRWGNAASCTLLLAAAVLALGMSHSIGVVVIAYLLFASTVFTIGMFNTSGWAEVLHARELAIGAAAINTIGQIGSFVAPYAWGLAMDATGSFQAALVTLALAALLAAGLILQLRSQLNGAAIRLAAPQSS